MNKEDRLLWAKKRLAHYSSCFRISRREIDEDFKFAAGDQWNESDRKALEEQGRPILTFNFIKPYIDVIAGLAQQNKTKARAMPVDPSDQFLCDVLNDIAYWVYNTYDIESDEDDAFENATICGRGGIALDVQADPKRIGEIKFITESPYPTEFLLDPSGRKPNGVDSSAMFWEKWLTKEDFKIFYPKIDIEKIWDNESYFETPGSEESAGTIDLFDADTEEDDYKELDIDFYDRKKEKIRVIHMEYWENYTKYLGFNPLTGEVEEFSKENLGDLKKRFPDFEYSTIQDKRLEWLQFIGDKILYNDDSPLPLETFSLHPIVAYKDKRKGISDYFGVVRLLKDPQKEINKRWSQTLNLLNNQVQGGLFAEVDAFQDTGQAEDSMKESGAITWLKSGALTKNKIQEKRIPTFPDAPMRMQEFSNQSLRFISGINPDLLGQDRGRQEPGVVVRMRQQQGMTVISKLFNNFNNAKKKLFGNILRCILKYMPDRQMLRILGEGEKYAIEGSNIIDKQNNKIVDIRDLRNIEYNVNVQSAPGNMTKIAYELSMLTEMAQNGMPIDPRLIISKLDLPSDEKTALTQYIDQQQQMQAETMQQEQGLEQAKLQQKAQQTMAKLQLDVEKLKQKQQEASGEQLVERANKIDEIKQKEADSRRRHSIDIAELRADERKLVFDLISKLRGNEAASAL